MSAFPIPHLLARYASAATRPVRSGLVAAGGLGLDRRLRVAEAALHRWLLAYSVSVLRVSVGIVFLAFGALKIAPGVSPAQDLVEHTTGLLTFGLVPGGMALALVAALECTIGVLLVSGRAKRAAMLLLAVNLVGILSPLALLTTRLFAGPHGAPTLEGQYVMKDVIVVGAALVIAASALTGGLPSEAPEV